MAKKNKQIVEKKDNSSLLSKKQKGKKKLDISIVAVVDNIIFTQKEIWAYYRLSNNSFEYLSEEARVALASDLINSFVQIIGDRQDNVECHLINTSLPLDLDEWESTVDGATSKWNRAPGYEDFMSFQKESMFENNYSKKITYLGIMIGRRGETNLSAANILENIKETKDTLQKMLNSITAVRRDKISENEENIARAKEREIWNRLLTSRVLNPKKMTAEEILLNIKKQFYPCMKTPYLDISDTERLDEGDLDIELCSNIENHLRYLKITQLMKTKYSERGRDFDLPFEEYTGYRAVITISKLPRETTYPYNEPFMYLLENVGYPCTTFARFTLISHQKMKKETDKKKKEMSDEIKNMSAAPDSLDNSLGMNSTGANEAARDLYELQDALDNDRFPWVQGTYRIVLEAGSPETLKEWYADIKSIYNSEEVLINWTSGDQIDLFLEQMPGDHLREKSYRHTTDLAYFATSGWNFSSDVGDNIGYAI